MKYPQSAPRSDTRRTAGILLITLALVGAACSGSGSGPSSSQPTTTDASTPSVQATTTTTLSPEPTTTTLAVIAGEEWSALDTEFDIIDFAVGGDVLWAISRTAEGTLLIHSTVDGQSWETYDSSDLGVERVDAQSSIGMVTGTAAIGATADDVIVALAAPPVEGVSADGVSGDVWLLRGDGTSWEALSPADSGIDQRLEGAYNFRFSTIVEALISGDDTYIVVDSQWWEPYSTGGSDFGAITSIDGGPWITSSSPRDYELGPDGTFLASSAVIGSDGSILVVGYQGYPIRPAFWLNSGSSWDTDLLPIPDGFDAAEAVHVAVGPDGYVVAGFANTVDGSGLSNHDEQLFAWTSADGIMWEVHPTGLTPDSDPDVSVMWIGDRYLMCVQGGGGPLASNDGILWEPVTSLGCPAGGSDIAAWRGGFVGRAGVELWVTPPLS